MTASLILQSIYKKHFPKMVIALARYTGLHDLATAEDIVSEAFAEAARQWVDKVPDHPEAWLYRVCRNLALNHLRHSRKFDAGRATDLEIESNFVYPDESAVDDQLRMLLACTHPDFSARNQVIFALRYVAGFRIEQIANILGSPADTVTKTLLRMRELIVRKNISFHSEGLRASPHQSSVLHKIVYLMFSEGYKTSGGRSILNLELCEDALSLSIDISNRKELCTSETHALIALILFNLSRFEARFNEDGDLVELEHQDRSRWNQDLIRAGVHHMNQASTVATAYHVEASIAWLHATAPSFSETDWTSIAALYERLLEFNDSPFVRMNQSIAVFYSGQVLTALHQLTKLGESAFMQQHYLLHMALGKIHHALGESSQSLLHYKRALDLSTHEIEKRHIRKLIAAV